MGDNTERVTVELSQSAALVLFEFLSRFSDEDKLTIEDPSEGQVLNEVLCGLESSLVAPFRKDYSDLLAQARAQVREGTQP